MQINPMGVEWQAIRKLISARIEAMRDELEGNRPEAETAALRGGISELRDLIARVERRND